MLDTELQQTLGNGEEIQLTKMRIEEVKSNQGKIKEQLKQANDYRSRARTSFLSGVLQTTGSVLGSVFVPVFGGLFGYGAARSLNLAERIDQKVETNLRKID